MIFISLAKFLVMEFSKSAVLRFSETEEVLNVISDDIDKKDCKTQ